MPKRAKPGDNAVRHAVEKVGGVTQAAVLCGVRERQVWRWIAQGTIKSAHAITLADAAGISAKKLAGLE